MKRILTFALAMVLVLSACSSKEEKTWTVVTAPDTDHTTLSADELCSAYAGKQAKFWQREAGQWQLSIIEAPDWAVAIYIADQTYEITAPSLDELKKALQEYPCGEKLDEILAEEPYYWFANTGVENPDSDGWGVKEVLGYTLPWPATATDTGDGWRNDYASFRVTNILTQDDASEDLKAMAQTLEDSELESATILYYQDTTYQGLAFEVDGKWDISLARFDNMGSIYLSVVQQPDFTYALELAERYSMKVGMQALEVVEPYYSR